MTRILHLLIFPPLFLLTMPSIAQDNDKPKWCNEDISKKAIALYEKGTDKKKYSKPERLDFLQKCLQMEPDFAEALYAAGMEFIARAKLEEKPMTVACRFLRKAIQVCPDVHSEPYYYIGADFYERVINDSAKIFLQKFIAYKSDDEKKFSKDYRGQLYNANMMLKSMKKEDALKKNVPFDPRVVLDVSTERDEYLAYISPDDKYCYFVRKVPMDNKNQVFATDREKEMFMVAARDKTGRFSKGEPMEYPFNATEDNQGGCSISIDNKHLYFAMAREEGGLQPNIDLYISDYVDDVWGPIRKLSPKVNDPKYWDSQPTIAADGLTLYFASDRPGGFGGVDIYETKRDQKTGEWSIPVNLGPAINTAGDERTPFIHSDSETLYFSSGPNKRTGGGHTGFGGADIFYVRKDEKGQWMEPVNIGSPINGETDDTGFFVSSDSKTGYFFSFNEGKVAGRGVGRSDLYGFELYSEARPQVTQFVKGSIKDKEGNAVKGAVVEVKDIVSKKSTFATVDSSNGEYMVAVKEKKPLLLTVKKDEIVFNSKKVEVAPIPPGGSNEPTEVQLQVNTAKEGSNFVIENILYNTNSAELKPESFLVISSFADYLKDHEKIKIEIQGHTDNVGNPADNEALSTNRAFSVKSALEELGVKGDRIMAKGFGASKPVADNGSEEGRAKNRRTEFVILEL